MKLRNAAILPHIALFLLLALPTLAEEQAGSGDDDDSAAAGDDDDSAAAGDDDDSAGEAGTMAPPRTAETIVRAALPWRVSPRSPLQPDPQGTPGLKRLSRRDLEQGAGPLSDPVHALQLLPGVNSDQAANAWLVVRGGGRDELVIELDGIRIREFTHLTGIMSVLDSALVQDVELYAASPPAYLPESLSATMHLSYLDRPHDRFDGRVSLDALGVSAHIALSLDKERKHHLVLGGRQSFLTAYMAIARELGAWDGAATEANYGDYFARYRYDPSPDSTLRMTLLHTRDRVLLDDVNLSHWVLGAAADWTWRYSNRGRLHATFSHSSNSAGEPEVDFNYPHQSSWHNRLHRTMLRAVVSEQVGQSGQLQLGIEAAVSSLDIGGRFPDTRSVPTWAYLPLAELDLDRLELNSDSTWPELVLSATGHLPNLIGPLSLQLGLRASLLNRSGRPYASPRVGLILPLPSGTTVRTSLGLHHQQRLDPLVVDRDLGNPDLLPERAIHVTVGIEQWFPVGVLLAAEGWYKGYDQLVHYAESEDGLAGSFVNEGRGRAYGLEATVGLRRGRVDVRASYAVLRSTRVASPGAVEVDAAGDQRHEIDAQASVLLGKKRRLKIGADYSYASGWPISTLQRVNGPSEDTYRWHITGFNDRRLDDQHRVSLQLEGSHPFRHWRLRGTIRISAMPGGAGFTEDCPPLTDEEGAAPVCAPLQFLPPIMPWLGIQADW